MSDYTIKGTLKLETKEALAAIESIKKAMGSVSTSSSSAATSTFSGVKQGATNAKQELKSLDEAYAEYAAKRLRQEALLARYKSDPTVIKAQQELNKLKTTGVGLSKEAAQAEALKANILKSQNAIITKMAAKQAGGAQHSPLTRQTAMDSRAFADLQNSAEKAQKQQDELKKSTSALKDEYTGLDQAIGVVKRGLVGMVAFGTIAAVGDMIQESFKLAATLEDLKTGIDYVSKEYSIAGPNIVKEMRAMSQGILSEAEAVKRVNQGALLGGKELAEAMPDLFDIVRTNARAMGIDTGYALESMTIGLGRLSARWLDNLGIVIDTRRAYRELAGDLGKTVGELTDAERRIALVNEVISKYGREGDISETLLTTSEEVQSAASSWDDYRAALGKTLTETKIFKNIAEDLDLATESVRVRQEMGQMKGVISNLADESGKYSDEWYRLSDIVSQINVDFLQQDWTGGVDKGTRALVPLIVAMEHADRAAIRSQLPEHLQNLIDSLNRFYDQKNRTRDTRPIFDSFSTEADDKNIEAGLKQIDKHAKELQELGVPLDKVRAYSRDARKELLKLQEAMSSVVGPFNRQAMYNEFLEQLEIDAAAAADALEFLIQKMNILAGGSINFVTGIASSQVDLFNTLRDNYWKFQDEYDSLEEQQAAEDKRRREKAASEYKSYYSEIQGYAEQAALTGLEVKASDFTDKDRLDAPLEAVRRLRDIANIGTKSPWYEVFEVPDDVVKSGEYAIRKWAKELADRGADLRDISLIDKDAFLRELGEIETAKREREAVLAQLTQWAMEAGFNPTQAKAYAGSYVGEPTAEGVAQGLTDGLKEAGLGSQVGSILQASIEKSQDEYKSAGAAMADKVRMGIEKYFQDHKLVIPVALATTGVNVDVEPISWDRGDV